jgi:hypothetical protein
MEEGNSQDAKAVKKPGRPQKPSERLRRYEVKVRFCQHELALVKAKAAGRPLAIVVRDLALGAARGKADRVPAVNREVVQVIWKYTRELRPLVRLVEAGRSTPQLASLLEQHLRAISKVQHDLLHGGGR